jgi:uncharacterized protein
MTVHVRVPHGFDHRGRTAEAESYEDHVRDMIELLLFTSPGERVNRPDFGTGVLQLVFAPNSAELAASVEYTTHAGLTRWLSDIVAVQELQVTADDSTLRVDVRYVVLRTGQSVAQSFEREIAR